MTGIPGLWDVDAVVCVRASLGVLDSDAQMLEQGSRNRLLGSFGVGPRVWGLHCILQRWKEFSRNGRVLVRFGSPK